MIKTPVMEILRFSRLLPIVLAAALALSDRCLAAEDTQVRAKLYRVDEGVFELHPGKSIDLTDRQVLLSFVSKLQDYLLADGRFRLLLNGGSLTVAVGQRIDLKRFGSTRKIFEDKDECFVDVVDFVVPKGAPATATFRLSCL